MAELHIQRKKNVWAWVIALIVVLLLIGAALMWMNGSRSGAAVAPPTNATPVASVAAADSGSASPRPLT